MSFGIKVNMVKMKDGYILKAIKKKRKKDFEIIRDILQSRLALNPNQIVSILKKNVTNIFIHYYYVMNHHGMN